MSDIPRGPDWMMDQNGKWHPPAEVAPETKSHGVRNGIISFVAVLVVGGGIAAYFLTRTQGPSAPSAASGPVALTTTVKCAVIHYPGTPIAEPCQRDQFLSTLRLTLGDTSALPDDDWIAAGRIMCESLDGSNGIYRDRIQQALTAARAKFPPGDLGMPSAFAAATGHLCPEHYERDL